MAHSFQLKVQSSDLFIVNTNNNSIEKEFKLDNYNYYVFLNSIKWTKDDTISVKNPNYEGCHVVILKLSEKLIIKQLVKFADVE
jgi:hypothetical protein